MARPLLETGCLAFLSFRKDGEFRACGVSGVQGLGRVVGVLGHIGFADLGLQLYYAWVW